MLHDHSEDEDANEAEHNLGVQRNSDSSVVNGHDGEVDDDVDDGMDDDMMDKISSSPSIVDGGYSCAWVPRSVFLDSPESLRLNSTLPYREDLFSSPYVQTPAYLPFVRSMEDFLEAHHQEGEYRPGPPPKREDSYSSELVDRFLPLPGEYFNDFREIFEDTIKKEELRTIKGNLDIMNHERGFYNRRDSVISNTFSDDSLIFMEQQTSASRVYSSFHQSSLSLNLDNSGHDSGYFTNFFH